MDLGLLLVITLFTSGLQWLTNRQARQESKEDTLDIQHDAQEENARQADIDRKWQEEMYNKYYSPSAMESQFKSLGASDSAALMSALGVSPSVASGASASTGPASGLGVGVSTTSQLLDSLTQGFRNYMEGQKLGEETKWISPVNQANIDKTLGDLELHWKEFGLQEKTFYEISKPLAQMSLNKTQQEIAESISRIDKMNEEVKMIQQQVKESKQNVNESVARTDLYKEQTNTEIARQDNLAADTSLKESQTTGQDLENRLSALDVEISEETGINVRLGVSQQGALIVTTLGKRLSDNIPAPPFTDESALSWSDFIKSTKTTLQALNASKLNQATGYSSYQRAWDFINNHFKGSSYERVWNSKKHRIHKNFRDYINKSPYAF